MEEKTINELTLKERLEMNERQLEINKLRKTKLLQENKELLKEIKKENNKVKLENIEKIASDEEWKELENYNCYKVSNYGRIFNYRTGKLIKSVVDKKRHNKIYVSLNKGNNEFSSPLVASLVAKAFCENPNGLSYIKHLDNDESNNYYKNLEFTNHQIYLDREAKRKLAYRVVKIYDNDKLVKTCKSLTECVQWLKEQGNEKVAISMVSNCLRGVKGRKRLYGYTLKYGDEKYAKVLL